jgi:hypothetical protein
MIQEKKDGCHALTLILRKSKNGVKTGIIKMEKWKMNKQEIASKAFEIFWAKYYKVLRPMSPDGSESSFANIYVADSFITTIPATEKILFNAEANFKKVAKEAFLNSNLVRDL